jgi:hypothetical protein
MTEAQQAQAQTIPTGQASEAIEIQDLNQFVQMLVAWHNRSVATLRHFLKVPEGTEMMIGDEKPVVLEGDMLTGLKAGIELGLMELGTLPFAYELEDEQDAPAAPEAPHAAAQG